MIPAASDLGNISPGDEFWYWLAFVGIVCLLGVAAAKAIDGVRWWRGQRAAQQGSRAAARVRGAHPASLLGRRLAAAEAETQALSMRGVPDSWTPRPDGIVPLDQLVVNAEFERLANQLHWESVRDTLDGGDAA